MIANLSSQKQKSSLSLLMLLCLVNTVINADTAVVAQLGYDQSDPQAKFLPVKQVEASAATAITETNNEIAINRRCFKKGMTFAFGTLDSANGIYRFACNALPTNDNGSAMCGQFYGDTWCYRKRRVLCINKLGLNRPPYFVPAGQAVNNGWTEGIVKASPPVIGCSFATKGDVDAYCTKLFGCNWIGAEFHDGRYHPSMTGYTFANFSWNSSLTTKGFSSFWTYGQNLPQTSQRYWVTHGDVYGANPNCWN